MAHSVNPVKEAGKSSRDVVNEWDSNSRSNTLNVALLERDDPGNIPEVNTSCEHTSASQSNDVYLNIRLLSGASIQDNFSLTDTLRKVKELIDSKSESSIGSYNLATPYPRKVFLDAELSKTLLELGLSGRQALIVVPHQRGDVSSGGDFPSSYKRNTVDGSSDGDSGGHYGILKRIFSYANPFSYLGYFLPSSGTTESEDGGSGYGPNHTLQSGGATRGSAYNDRPTAGRVEDRSKRPTTSRFRSNIHTLKHDEDDDRFGDRNAFWNGNSTQYGGNSDSKYGVGKSLIRWYKSLLGVSAESRLPPAPTGATVLPEMSPTTSEVSLSVPDWGRLSYAFLCKLRTSSPLVQCITNFVSMDLVANVLSSAGASPAMIHCIEELPDFTPNVAALCVNVGTLSAEWVPAMKAAAELATRHGRPWVLDPVAAGASRYRMNVCLNLIALRPTVIRGNASEIIALSSASIGGSKGVDSSHNSSDAIEAAKTLARESGAVVAITGAMDIITDGRTVLGASNGVPMLQKITATGCSVTAIIAAFVAVDPPRAFEATSCALSIFGIAGEIGMETAKGPASLRMHMVDALHGLDEATVLSRTRIAALS